MLLAAVAARAAEFTITLTSQESAPPKWVPHAGKAVGYCPDLIAAIERVEPRIHFTGMENVRSLSVLDAGLTSGATGAACALLDSPQRRLNAIAVGKPLFQLRHRLAAAAGDDVVVNSLADLARLHALVNTTRGGAYVPEMRAMGIPVDDTSGDTMVNLKKTLAGHGRFTYISEQPMFWYLRSPALKGKLRVLPAIMREEPSYFWMSRKANPEAVRLTEQALASLRASGELARLYERWTRITESSEASVP